MKNQENRRLVLAAACIINLCIGSIYAWSVFSKPMAAVLGADPGSLAIVFTIASGVGPITMITGGKIIEKLGARTVIRIGALLYGFGMIGSGFSTSLGMLCVTYGLCSGLGLGMIYGCTINNTIQFFPDKKGMIGGLTTASYGLSSVLIPPVANALIGSLGILWTFRVIGMVFMGMILAASFLIRTAPQAAPEAVPGHGGQITGRPDRTWREMLQDPAFYIMILMLLCGGSYGLMIISQASPIAQNLIGVTPATAAICVSVIALFNAGGRVAAGYLSDRLGRIQVLTVMFLLSALAIALLLTCREGSLVVFMISTSIIGMAFGAFMGVFPGFTADQFGNRYNSVNYGIMFIGFALAGILGPTILNRMYQAEGSYHGAFYVCLGLILAGLVLTVLYRRLGKQGQKALFHQTT